MKLIIDIPDEEYNRINEWEDNITGYQTSLVLYRAVRNGTPYEERPQGKWLEENTETGALGIKYTWFKCSQCGWDSSLVIPKNFCPNCGADMRGEEK